MTWGSFSKMSGFGIATIALGLVLTACGSGNLASKSTTPESDSDRAITLVEDYLKALADEDFDKAIALANLDPATLGDLAVTRSVRNAPAVTDVTNLSATPYARGDIDGWRVTGSYRHNGAQGHLRILVDRGAEQGTLSLPHAMARQNLSGLAAYRPRINGVPVSPKQARAGVMLLPGSYRVTLADKTFQVAKPDRALNVSLVPTANEVTGSGRGPGATLRPAARAAAEQAVRDLMASCAGLSTERTPCTPGALQTRILSDTDPVAPGTVRRSVKALSRLQWEQSYGASTSREVKVAGLGFYQVSFQTKLGLLGNWEPRTTTQGTYPIRLTFRGSTPTADFIK